MAERDRHETQPPDRFLRAAEARQIFGAGVCHSTWWRWSKQPDFPRRYRLGPRTVGWKESEVAEFFANRREADPPSRPEQADSKAGA